MNSGNILESKIHFISNLIPNFSCESDDDEDFVAVKHARTGAAKKKKKKAESEEDEDDENFACVKCGKYYHHSKTHT